MKKVFFVALTGLLLSTAAQAQTVNMERYISLTVKNGKKISLSLKADFANTPVRIVSGDNTTNITVGTKWSSYSSYTAAADTMRIYGNVKGFNCSFNKANITAIDVSHNTQLTELNCPNNQIDAIDVTKNTLLTGLSCGGNLLTSIDISHNTQLTTLDCRSNNLTAIDVSKNTQLIRVNCEKNKLTSIDVNKNILLKELYCGFNKLTSIDVSKNTQLTGLDCRSNNLTSIDVSKNTLLSTLSCDNNQLTAIDVTKNTQLTGLDCKNNQLATIDVTKNPLLLGLYCGSNKLTAIDVSKNTQLTGLDCENNRLTTIDVSICTELNALNCSQNQLTSINISGCNALRTLHCYRNNFSTYTLDRIYCSLPDVVATIFEYASIFPLGESSDQAEIAIVTATNAQNAINKHWNVRKYKDDGNYTDINTTGSYDCTSTGIDEASSEEALSIYPTPTDDELHLSTSVQEVRIYNMYGIEVTRAANTDRLAVSHLPKGVYLVHADGAVLKMIKQ